MNNIRIALREVIPNRLRTTYRNQLVNEHSFDITNDKNKY